MKTPEDEAFDELARKQGAWGGGYQAKRQMAADKMQEPVCDKDPQGCWNVRCQLGKQCKNLAQPAQEPVAWQWLGSAHFRKKIPKNADITAWNPVYSALQREWVGLTDKDKSELAKAQHSWEDLCLAVESKLKERNHGT